MKNGYRNIAYSCDKNFITQMAVSIYSAVSEGYIHNAHFHLIIDGCKEEDTDLLRSIIEKYNSKVSFYESPKLPEELKVFGNRTSATYYRLFLGAILPNEIDRVLYIDCDTLIRGGLDDFYDTNMEANIVAGVQDITCRRERLDIGLDSNNIYVNAGILLINVEQWRKHNIERQAIDLMHKRSFKNNDQDIINILCKGKMVIVDPKYNVMTSMFEYNRKQLMQLAQVNSYYDDNCLLEAKNKPSIIHFSGCVYDRPWFAECDHCKCELYRMVWKNSGVNNHINSAFPSLKARIMRKLHKLPFPIYLVTKRIRGF